MQVVLWTWQGAPWTWWAKANPLSGLCSPARRRKSMQPVSFPPCFTRLSCAWGAAGWLPSWYMPVKMGSVGGRDCAVEFVGLTSRQVHAMTKMTDPLTQALRGLFNVGQRLRSRWTLGGPACAARQVWTHTFAMCSSSCCCACAPRFSVTMPRASCNKSPPFKTSCAFAAARAKQPEMVSCHSCACPTVPLYSAR